MHGIGNRKFRNSAQMAVEKVTNSRWLVLYTKPRNEKKVAERLASQGYEVYCPVRKVKRNWSDRWKWMEEPLFPSYLFIRVSEKEREGVFNTPGVVRFLFWLKKPAVVQEKEINLLKRWLNEFDHQSIEVFGLSVGQRVLIQSGPLMNKEATVSEVRGQVLQLVLEELQLVVRINARETQLEMISNPSLNETKE